MYKSPIAMAIGLTVALTTSAHADTIIIQGTPSFDPAIISHGPMPTLPGIDGSILNDPAFHRLAQMCDTLGMACGADHVTADGGIAPAWTPEHRLDAEKRLAQMIEDRHTVITALEDHFEALPAPRLDPRPHQLFGWSTPFGVPRIAPVPHGVAPPFGHVFPSLPNTIVPHITLPRPVMPNIHPQTPNLSGFYHRLNNPALVPHGLFRPHNFPGHSFPWRSF